MLKKCHPKQFKSKQVSVADMIYSLDKGLEAYNVFAKNNSLDELRAYLLSLPEIPPERISDRPTVMRRIANKIIEEFKPHSVIRKDFSAIYKGLDDILIVDAGPQGALLQNMVRACLNRVVDLEAASSSSDSSRSNETSIVKYVAEIRNLVDSINSNAKNLAELREGVVELSQKENQIVLEAVRETVAAMFPNRLEDFQTALLAKLTHFKDYK